MVTRTCCAVALCGWALLGTAAADEPQLNQTGNPLLAPWNGGYGGYPAFDRYRLEQFKPALEAAMAQELREVDAIAANPAPPSFVNTIEALEQAGAALNRVQSVYHIWSSTLNSGGFQAVQSEMDPVLAGFSDQITQNEPLFRRIEVVYESAARTKLTPEQQRRVWVYERNFVRAGARLRPDDKARLTKINQRLAGLYASFSQNLLAEESGHVMYLTAADLGGLPDSLRDAAAAAAAERGRPGEWAVLNTRSSTEPFLTYSDRRDLREKVWRTFYSRGDNHDEHDNSAIITEILKLRAERATLLGYATHAHWRVEPEMAKTPENALALMMQVWPVAVARVHEEVADMQALADQEGAGIKIAGWDYRYYAEKVRKAKYELDMAAVKPYLQLDKLREGMFWAAGQLYGYHFTELQGLPVADPHVRVWEVRSGGGQHVGLWYFDPYARTGKDSGAWMNEYRSQQQLENVSPIVSNNTNFVPPRPGEPVLISWDDAVTLFHEFGHALHGLNSKVWYPSLAGTSVARDFVEFPSQLNENWLETPEVLSRFCIHYRSGEPIPADLVQKIKRAHTFNSGFQTVEYLAGAIVDMKLHLAGGAAIDPDRFESDTLSSLGMPQEIVMRHRTTQFGHVFSGDQYSAGYYSYLWSEVLDHDAFEAFLEAGGPYDPRVAKRYHDDILSVGNTLDPAEAYRHFRGRDPRIDAYLRAKGFPVPASPTAGASATP